MIVLFAFLCISLSAFPAFAETETGSYPTLRFLRSAPSEDALVVAEIPAGTKLTVTPVSGTEFAKTTYNGITGFVKHLKWSAGSWDKSGAKAPPAAGEPLYYLVLKKSEHTLTVYAADRKGGHTNEVFRTITTATGKRTTPTPTGKFTLTTREAWHFFGKSYAPYAIKYANGKYLHGPLYKKQDVTTMVASSALDIGTDATGGCLRMSFVDIKWIYENCGEGTILEIV
jgi:lipoprotein-anchoring transpeptidase ErfK/SrfK